jgi:hypothetical protein
VTTEASTPIPEEWRDPRHVIPHLARQFTDWHASLLVLEQDLGVLEGALVGGSVSPLEAQGLLLLVEGVRARLQLVQHEVATRATAFRLIADVLGDG